MLNRVSWLSGECWVSERERDHFDVILIFNKNLNKTIELSKTFIQQKSRLEIIGQSWNEAFSSLLFLSPNQTEVFLTSKLKK